MKKLLLAGLALPLLSGLASAADLPRRMEPPPPVFTAVPVFTWTGAYAGLHTAYTFTDRQRITTVGNDPLTRNNVALQRRAPSVRSEDDGLSNIGGGGGYLYQFNPGNSLVVGAAVDITWTDLRDSVIYRGPRLAANGFRGDQSGYIQSLEWLGTATGKVGYAFDRFLVYGTGGFAFGSVDYKALFLTPPAAGANVAYRGIYNDLKTGFAYGGGFEYAIPEDSFLNYFSVGKLIGLKTSAVTLKAEYLRYDLGSQRVLVGNTGIGPTGSYTSRFRTEGSIVRAGFNYKLD